MMLDKNGVKIKKGRKARFGGLVYQVLYAGFHKLVLTDGAHITNLKTHNYSLKESVKNIEVITRYDEASNRRAPIR